MERSTDTKAEIEKMNTWQDACTRLLERLIKAYETIEQNRIDIAKLRKILAANGLDEEGMQ